MEAAGSGTGHVGSSSLVMIGTIGWRMKATLLRERGLRDAAETD